MSTSPLRLLVLLGLVSTVLLGSGACGGPSPSRADTAVRASGSARDGDATILVLPPDDFARAVDADPEMPLLNVHVPYEGHLDGTDAFVAFDDIAASSLLPDDRDQPIAVYCRTGQMSAVAARTLISLGYTRVLDLRGGLTAWGESGRPVLHDAGVTSTGPSSEALTTTRPPGRPDRPG
ncbi:MAG: rhodanese-like domain-containing protein [Acidimicrobiales bacterium]|jgi:rhodanese-related sulfurtransferase|nr:rhodanese-like domain-containing protein [Acidimicrobiales bacterium]